MNLTDRIPDLPARHYLNNGSPLTLTYQRIEDALWARDRGVPPFSNVLSHVPTSELERVMNRTVIAMAQAAIAGGVIDNAGGSTRLEIFKAYQNLGSH